MDKFDEMAASAATHPSAYTKAAIGWLGGVFASTRPGAEFGETLYLKKAPPPLGSADDHGDGVDPYLLMIDLERFDNVEKVKIEN